MNWAMPGCCRLHGRQKEFLCSLEYFGVNPSNCVWYFCLAVSCTSPGTDIISPSLPMRMKAQSENLSVAQTMIWEKISLESAVSPSKLCGLFEPFEMRFNTPAFLTIIRNIPCRNFKYTCFITTTTTIIIKLHMRNGHYGHLNSALEFTVTLVFCWFVRQLFFVV